MFVNLIPIFLTSGGLMSEIKTEALIDQNVLENNGPHSPRAHGFCIMPTPSVKDEWCDHLSWQKQLYQ